MRFFFFFPGGWRLDPCPSQPEHRGCCLLHGAAYTDNFGGTRGDLAGLLLAAAGRKVVRRVGSGTAGHGEAGSQRAELRMKLKVSFS